MAACARSPAAPDDVQIMYGVAGERRLDEYEVPWLPGIDGAKPVRIGNAAVQQLQLDVYGEVLDAFYVARRAGLVTERGDLGAGMRPPLPSRDGSGGSRTRASGRFAAAASISPTPR